MEITLNGEIRELATGATVGQLLQQLELANRRTAVEVNQEVVPRSAYGEVTLEPGDAVEIVHAVGGG